MTNTTTTYPDSLSQNPVAGSSVNPCSEARPTNTQNNKVRCTQNKVRWSEKVAVINIDEQQHTLITKSTITKSTITMSSLRKPVLCHQTLTKTPLEQVVLKKQKKRSQRTQQILRLIELHFPAAIPTASKLGMPLPLSIKDIGALCSMLSPNPYQKQFGTKSPNPAALESLLYLHKSTSEPPNPLTMTNHLHLRSDNTAEITKKPAASVEKRAATPTEFTPPDSKKRRVH